MNSRTFLLVVLLASGAALAQPQDDPHPAPPGQGASPPTTQGPSRASRKADETMSEKAPRPLPGKDAEPGPDGAPPVVKKPRSGDADAGTSATPR